MLLGQPTYEEDEDDEHSIQSQTVENSSHSPSPNRYGIDTPFDTATTVSGASAAAAATTLVDGALPVREFPNNLTSEPASLCHSAASSVNGDATPQWSRAASEIIEETTHQEELRCVVAIVRQ